MKNPFDNNEMSSYNIKTFGKSVRERRKQLGLSCRELARRIDISPVYLSYIENGKRPAPYGLNSGKDYMSILAKELGLTESQEAVFNSMAKISHLDSTDFIEKYFCDNPSSFKFILKAIEEDMTNEDWDKLYKLIANEK